jgi:hypothetical protein
VVTEESISFLVQGPVKIIDSMNLTEICIKSIRRYFPKSRIVFSTDYGVDTSTLNFDEVVFSKAKIDALIENDQSGHLMSVNYQISSTKAGLSKITTPYTVKLRSDMVFGNSNLVKILNNRPQIRPDTPYVLTKGYVVILDWSTVNPRRFLKFPHHPSDHFYAGETEDIKAIWNVPEMPQELMRWYEKKSYPTNARHGNNLSLYRAEAWIWYNYIRKFVSNRIENSYCTSNEIINESLGFMCANLLISSSNQTGVYESSYSKRGWKTQVKMLTYYDWVRIARRSGVKVRNVSFDLHAIKIIILRNIITMLKLENYIYIK